MRKVCLMAVALVALGGLAVAGDFTEPYVIADTRAAPEYPPAAKAAGFEGAVSVAAVVNADGSVGVVEILECSTPKLGFEEAAMEAIRGWQFEPAREGGERVDSVYAYEFYFESPGKRSTIPAYVAGQYLAAVSYGGVLGKDASAHSRQPAGAMQSLHSPATEFRKHRIPARGLGGLYKRSELLQNVEGGKTYWNSNNTAGTK